MQNLHTIVDNLKVSERPIQSYMCEGVTMMEVRSKRSEAKRRGCGARVTRHFERSKLTRRFVPRQDYNDSECEFEVEFNPEDEIVKWSGKLHSVKTIVKQMKV